MSSSTCQKAMPSSSCEDSDTAFDLVSQWRRAIGVRTPTLLHRRLRLPTARTRTHHDVPGRLGETLRELAHLSPGVAVSVADVVAQLSRSGVVRDRTTVGDWLQADSLDAAGVVFRVDKGYYALRDLGDETSGTGCPAVPMAETEARVLKAAAALQSGGETSWGLLELVAEVAKEGPALSRRRLHDVVVAMRMTEPPFVERVAYGRFRATDA